MEIYEYNILFSELEKFDLVSLGFFVHGCPLNCKHCSWKENPRYHYELPWDAFKRILDIHNDVDCILFLGGEWLDDFDEYLVECKNRGFLTALYTGLDNVEDVDPKILKHLDIIKIGHWDEKLGGINSPTTNQKLIKLSDYNLNKGV